MKRWWRDEEMKEDMKTFRKNQIATRWWWKKSKRFPSAKSAKSSLRRRREPLEREPRGPPSHRCRHCPSHHRCPSRVHRPMATVRNCRVARWVPTNSSNHKHSQTLTITIRMLVIVSRIDESPFSDFTRTCSSWAQRSTSDNTDFGTLGVGDPETTTGCATGCATSGPSTSTFLGFNRKQWADSDCNIIWLCDCNMIIIRMFDMIMRLLQHR